LPPIENSLTFKVDFCFSFFFTNLFAMCSLT
jgi:hypothetical protein